MKTNRELSYVKTYNIHQNKTDCFKKLIVFIFIYHGIITQNKSHRNQHD